MSSSKNEIFVGIDIAKDTLEIAIFGEPDSWQVMNTSEKVSELADVLTALKVELIVLEASGGYEMLAKSILGQAGLPVASINPVRSRRFAQSLGKQAKTDRIDAQVLAHFGQALRPEPQKPSSEQQEKLSALITRRKQLKNMTSAEKNRIKTARSHVIERIQKHIDWIETELDDLEQEMEKLLKHNRAWQKKKKLLESVPGVGKVTSLTLLAYLPELGSLSHKKVAALVGVAPYSHDSGKWHGKRFIKGGREIVRSALYMAVLTAIKHNSIIKRFFDSLIARGKKFKVAMTACMRKLLTILNAMIRDQKSWLYA